MRATAILAHLTHQTTHRGRKRQRAAVLVSVITLTAGLTAAPASAAPGDLTCTANFQHNFTPPLTATNTTAKDDATSGLVGCTSPNGNYPTLKSGLSPGTGTATALGGSPCSLLLRIELKSTIEWSPPGNPKSHLDVVIDTNPVDGTVAFTATVTAGPLKGDTATAVAEAHPNPDCAVNGLSSLTSEAAQVVFN
ncbi:hypothetical protein [Streptomyces sp. KR80]|uniref:hypothetical protein n=1 Tax=Streptomyces sp. KR80 TaxID=3457426 RepID=UPI003FD4FACC